MAVTLLIVDDSPACRELLAQKVEAPGSGLEIRIIQAKNLSEAFELTLQENPNLTFLDLNMEGCSIVDVLKSIRRMNRPVIIVSGYASDHVFDDDPRTIYERCFAAGADDYLEKGTPRFDHAQLEWMKVVLKKQSPNAQD